MRKKLMVILSLLVMTFGTFGLTSTSAAFKEVDPIVQPKAIEGPGGGSECISLIYTSWSDGKDVAYAGGTLAGAVALLKKKFYGAILATWVGERILSFPDFEGNHYKIDTYLNGCDGTYIKRVTAYDEDWSVIRVYTQSQ
jgi:hypothetical protein